MSLVQSWKDGATRKEGILRKCKKVLWKLNPVLERLHVSVKTSRWQHFQHISDHQMWWAAACVTCKLTPVSSCMTSLLFPYVFFSVYVFAVGSNLLKKELFFHTHMYVPRSGMLEHAGESRVDIYREVEGEDSLSSCYLSVVAKKLGSFTVNSYLPVCACACLWSIFRSEMIIILGTGAWLCYKCKYQCGECG